MEKLEPETYQPRASLDEKPPVTLPEEKDGQSIIDSNQASDDETIKPGEASADSTGKEEPEYEYVTGLKLALVIIAVTSACFLMLLDNSIVATAIPRITSDFNSLNDIGWYGSAYLLASCALTPLAGKIYSQFSSKYSFMCFLAIFELGSLLCGVAQSSKMLIVGRAIAGIGGSGLMNGSLTIIAACVPLQKRAAYLGFMMAMVQLGILLGPLIGGLFTEYATWRWCFYINLPIGGLAFIFVIFIQIPERRVKRATKHTFPSIYESLDIPGFCLFAPAAIQCLLALEWGGTTYAWGSATVIGLFCGSAGTLAVFVAWEHHRGETAMIPLFMIKQRVVWSSCLTMFFSFGSMMTVTYYLAIYFQAVKGDSPTMSGVSTLPTIITTMIASITAGILVGRVGYYLPFAVFAGAGSAISVGILSMLTPTSSIGTWVGYQIVGGFPRGCGMQMPIIAIQNTLKPEHSAIAMSLVVFFQSFGGALFLSLDQTTFSSSLGSALHKFAPEVNAAAVVRAGATGFRAVIDKGSVPGVILAYNQATSHVFYVGAGASVGSVIFACGMGWRSIKKPKVVSPEA